jgi:uncharacterized membrane protein
VDLYHAAVNLLRLFALIVVGSLVIFAGIVRAVLEARGAGGRRRVARRITEHASLGLEFFVGATILNPTWTAVSATAVTIVVRRLITLSLGSLTREG